MKSMEETITIRNMRADDIPIIAKIHSDELSDSFLGKLGFRFLKKLYSYMFREKSFSCFVAENIPGICGYIAITSAADSFYSSIYKKHFISLAFEIMLKAIRHPVIIFQALKIFFSSVPSHLSPSKNVELLSIAVAEGFKSKGIGKRLLENELGYLKTINKNSIYVMVHQEILANKFYLSLGFTPKGLHNNLNIYQLEF